MKFSITSKSWVLLSTVIVIGVAFSIYFLVYVKGNEKDIVANNFRVLQQIVSNIKSLENSYHKNAEIRSLADSESAEQNNALIPANDEQCLEVAEKSQIDEDIIYGSGGLYFRVDTIINPNDLNTCPHYFTDYEIFFSNELFQRKDVFEQIIISKINAPNTEGNRSRNVLYSNGNMGIMDSSFHAQNMRFARDEITINDKQYISFNQRISDEEQILISGLILKSAFEQQKRSVSPILIFSLSIALMLIVLAMPLLKLKIMSLEERLHIKDVVFGVVSILIGPAVFILFLNATFIFSSIEKEHIQENLDSLSHKVEHNFQQELGRLVDQLNELNTYFSFVSKYSELSDSVFLLDEESLEMFSINFDTAKVFNDNQYDIAGYKVYDDIINNSLITFKHLKAAFWCTDAAQIMIFLSVFENPGYAQDLSHRRYISNILNNKPNYFKDEIDSIQEIAIESIKSVSDGSYEIGVGKATGGSVLPVMAISAKIGSMMGTIVEEGYGFCIIDKDGNTVFHSDIMKNMNENFIEETQGVFLPSIVSHIDMYETVNYNGKDQTIYFRPLDCLSDHYIATFINTEVFYAPITLSMISAFGMFLFYLLCLLLVYLLLYFSNFRFNKLKQTDYIFNFIRPYETSSFFMKYKHLSVVTIVIMLYLFVSISINSRHYDFIISELFLVIAVMLTCSFYSLTNELHKQKIVHSGFKETSKRVYKIVALVIIIIFIIRTISIFKKDPEIALILNALLGVIVVAYVIIEVLFGGNIFAIKFYSTPPKSTIEIQKVYRNFLILWVVLLSIFPINLLIKITYEKENEIFTKYRSLKLFGEIRDWNKTSSDEFASKFRNDTEYNLFIESMNRDSVNYGLIETKFQNDKLKSSIKFTKDEVKINPDSSIWVREMDSVIYSMNEIEVSDDEMVILLSDTSISTPVTTVSFRDSSIAMRGRDSVNYKRDEVEYFPDGSVIVKSKELIVNERKIVKITSEIARVKYYNREVFDDIYSKIRPKYNDRSEVSSSYVNNVASDNSWIFSTIDDYNVITHNPIFESSSSFTSIKIKEHGFFKDHIFSIIIVIIISVLILVNFLSFILIKIYGFRYKIYAEYVNGIRNKPFAGLFLKDEFFSNNSSYNNIFLVSVNSAHTPIVRDYFPLKSKKKLLTLDFYDFYEKMDEGIKYLDNEHNKLNRFDRDWGEIKKYFDKEEEKVYVLVEHFEFGFNDFKMNKLKLEILKYLVDSPSFKVIVKSEINATKLLDFYENSVKEVEVVLKKSSVENRSELEDKLNDLRIDYKKWQHLLGSFVKYIVPINTSHEKIDSNTRASLLHRKNFEQKEETKHGEFLDMLDRYIKSSKIADLPYEDKILTIQQMSYPYYFSVWNSLSKEERYLVYDIAKDGFVNTVNTNAILSLLVKGILIYDHSLRLMNDSFSNFVLTKVNSDEALEMEMESRKKGTWNTAFAVILLLIISIVIFLSIGQQSFLNDINAFLTAIAALVGLLIRFSGFLSFGGNKASAA